MKPLTAKRFLLPLTAIAVLGFGAPQAGAQGFLEMLLGRPPAKNQPARGEFPPPPKKKAARLPKISSPTYNTYKADRLVAVDFSALTVPQTTGATVQKAAVGGAAAGGKLFRKGLAGLEGYQLMAEPAIGKALVAWYAANPDFIWVDGAGPNARAKQALRTLGEAGSHGLAPADYAVEVPTGMAPLDRETQMIRFEMALSARVLRYIRDAQNGRVDPNRISTGYYDFPAKALELEAELDALASATDVSAYLETRHPQSKEYQALRVELEALKASAESQIVVDPKLLLKPGQSSAELPKILTLIARDLDDEMGGAHGETLARLIASETYVPELEPVIKAAQKKAGLTDDGVIGPRTVAALAGVPKAERIARVEYALEQLRWLPSNLGDTRVFINQPAFTASYIEDGEEKLNMKVVIGTVANQTAFFYDQIETVNFHPHWGVPKSILVNEMLPKLRTDPGYLDRAGYEVTDARGKRIPSASIDWEAYGARIPYNVRQLPGEANALGELKILFPNKFAIYMHDTPQKSLFQRDVRAFSHGCIRLQDPRGMAAALLGVSVDDVAQKLKRGPSVERVTRNIPVYVAYFTAWPNASGKVEYFNDIYGRDERLKQALMATEAVRTPSS